MARPALPPTLVTALSLVLLSACAGRMEDTVRKRASADFNCAAEQVTVTPGGSGGAYAAEGCARQDQYQVSCTLFGVSCTARNSTEQAEYEQAVAEQRAAAAAQPPPSSNPPPTAAPSSQPSSQPAAPAGPAIVSVTLRNTCPETVKLFFGDKPKFGSGTYSSLSANTTTSKQMQQGDMIWIVDDSQNGLSSFSAGAGSQTVEILPSCTGFKVR